MIISPLSHFSLILYAKQSSGSLEWQAKNVIVTVSETDADLIRDRCGEELQIKGVDEKYNITKEGRILESLIDKLFMR